MMSWLPPATLGNHEMTLLATSLYAAPAYERPDAVELLQRIYAGVSQAFSFPGGMMVCEPREGADGSKRLCILVFAGNEAIYVRKQLADDLRRLAAEWGCDTIETCAYDKRLADAIIGVGGKVESWNLTLSVKG